MTNQLKELLQEKYPEIIIKHNSSLGNSYYTFKYTGKNFSCGVNLGEFPYCCGAMILRSFNLYIIDYMDVDEWKKEIQVATPQMKEFIKDIVEAVYKCKKIGSIIAIHHNEGEGKYIDLDFWEKTHGFINPQHGSELHYYIHRKEKI